MAGKVKGNVETWGLNDISKVEAESETHLEDDIGTGGAAVIRMFEFKANPQAFKQYTPTKQELFNSHYKFIESTLWMDGLKVIPEVNPTVTLNKRNTKYRIFVGAEPAKGHLLNVAPRTLSEIAHNKPHD